MFWPHVFHSTSTFFLGIVYRSGPLRARISERKGAELRLSDKWSVVGGVGGRKFEVAMGQERVPKKSY